MNQIGLPIKSSICNSGLWPTFASMYRDFYGPDVHLCNMDYSWLWRCVSVAKFDYDQHTLDEIHGIDANNRDCALSTIVEPVVGSLDNQGLFAVYCDAIVVYDAFGMKALSNRFAVEPVDVVEKTEIRLRLVC